MMERCPWCLGNEKMIRYHDEEWGVPVHDDQKQFEFLMMEVMQCGLNWNMMIQKREIFRSCFDDFDFDKVAVYGETDIEHILGTDGMIRSRRKINRSSCPCHICLVYTNNRIGGIIRTLIHVQNIFHLCYKVCACCGDA